MRYRLCDITGACVEREPDRFKSRSTGWWQRNGPPSRFSRLLALMSQINIHPLRRPRCLPGGLREDRDNDDNTHDGLINDERHIQRRVRTIYNKLLWPAIPISLYLMIADVVCLKWGTTALFEAYAVFFRNNLLNMPVYVWYAAEGNAIKSQNSFIFW